MVAQRHLVIEKLCTYLQSYHVNRNLFSLHRGSTVDSLWISNLSLKLRLARTTFQKLIESSRNLVEQEKLHLSYLCMDSPIVTQLFRQLFRHRACHSLRSHSSVPFRRYHHGRGTQQLRYYSQQRGWGSGVYTKNESHWQQRSDLFPEDMSEEYKTYPMVTAEHLKTRRERPKRVKILTRDFIDGQPKPLPFSIHLSNMARR